MGGIVGLKGVVKGLDGCVQGFQVNNELLNVSSEGGMGTMNGCSSPDLCMSSTSILSPCPMNSSCMPTWRGFTCECYPSSLRPIDNQCVDICEHGACDSIGTSRCNPSDYC